MYANPKRQISPPSPDYAAPRRPCGCGLSHTFPHCDGSQLISKSRDPAKLVSCGSVEGAARSRTGALAVEA